MNPRIETEWEQQIFPPAKAEMMMEGIWQPVEVVAVVHSHSGSHCRVKMADGSFGKAKLGTLKTL